MTTLARYNGKLLKWNNSHIIPTISGPSYPTDGLESIWRMSGDVNDSYGTNNMSGEPVSYPIGGHPSTYDYSAEVNKSGYTIATSTTFYGLMTFAGWFYPMAGADGFIAATGGPVSLRAGFYLRLLNNQFYYSIERSGVSGSVSGISANDPLIYDSWNHFAFTNTLNGVWNCYLNGVQQPDLTHAVTVLDYGSCHFGVYSKPDHYSMVPLSNTYVASFFLYNRILTSAEISQLYNNGAGV
jgi:hypothetical protein